MILTEYRRPLGFCARSGGLQTLEQLAAPLLRLETWLR